MIDEEITMTIKESWLKDMVDAHNKLAIAISGLTKIKHMAKAKNLGAIYETAERTLANIGEK